MALRNEIIEDITQSYLEGITPENTPPPEQVRWGLLHAINQALLTEALADPSRKRDLKPLNDLTPAEVAQIMKATCHIRNVPVLGVEEGRRDEDLLCIYNTEGPKQGLYTSQVSDFRQVIRHYVHAYNKNDVETILTMLSDITPRQAPCRDPDLIAVGNGIYRQSDGTLLPFTPSLVFLSKSDVPYDPLQENPVIMREDGTTWDVESWIQSLSDDTEVVRLLWQVMAAIIRPNTRYNRSAYFYSEKGNNGKGTLCLLMKNLCGRSNYATISIKDFGEDFKIEPLIYVSAIINDENDVGLFLDKAANLKAIVTGDTIQINRKHKTPITYQFHGFMVQCINELPRTRDRSDSFYRRQIIIPFSKCFTGLEDMRIKSDYLNRPDVLRYVMRRILEMRFKDFDVPACCLECLEEYKEYNDPVRYFWTEMKDRFVWDLLPFDFLYDLYRSWFKRNNPSGKESSKQTFIRELMNAIQDDEQWTQPKGPDGKTQPTRMVGRMDTPERLILDYGLDAWRNKAYSGDDPVKLCMQTDRSKAYRGLRRAGT